MKLIREHIIFKSLTIMLVITLIIPSAVKFAHVFTHHNHKHDVCTGEKQTHLHEIDVDCDFYKFNVNTPFYFSHNNTELYSKCSTSKLNLKSYNFQYNHRPLSFSLRGPPVLV
jgi:hypothetical protein